MVPGEGRPLSSIYPPGQYPTQAIEQYTAAHLQNWITAALLEQQKFAELMYTDTHDAIVYVGLGDDGEDEALFVFHNEADIEDAWYQPEHFYALLVGGQMRVHVDPDSGDIEDVVILDSPEDLTIDEAIRIGRAFAKLSLGPDPLLTGIIGVSITEAGIPDAVETQDNPGWALLFMNATGTTGVGVTIHPDPAHPGETIVMEGTPYAMSSIYAPGTAPAQELGSYTQDDIEAWVTTAHAKQAEFAGLFGTATIDVVFFLGASSTLGAQDQLVFSFHEESDIIDHWYIPSQLLNIFGGDILTVVMDSSTGAVVSTDPVAP